MLRGVRRGRSWNAISVAGDASIWGLRKSRDASQPEMVRRVILGGGVPLVGPQEELHYPSGQTPRGFTSSPGREVK